MIDLKSTVLPIKLYSFFIDKLIIILLIKHSRFITLYEHHPAPPSLIGGGAGNFNIKLGNPMKTIDIFRRKDLLLIIFLHYKYK